MRRFARFGIICDVLRDLIHYVQFKKREKHPWKSATFLKVTLPHGVFFTFFKFYKWNQVAQPITYAQFKKPENDPVRSVTFSKSSA